MHLHLDISSEANFKVWAYSNDDVLWMVIRNNKVVNTGVTKIEEVWIFINSIYP